jgi:hypothetical protein
MKITGIKSEETIQQAFKIFLRNASIMTQLLNGKKPLGLPSKLRITPDQNLVQRKNRLFVFVE